MHPCHHIRIAVVAMPRHPIDILGETLILERIHITEGVTIEGLRI
jgi:hypothetical protein